MKKVLSIENPKISALSEIEEVERQLAIFLPFEYKKFLIENGGGYLRHSPKIINTQMSNLFLSLVFPLYDFLESFNYNFDEEAKMNGIVSLGATHAPISICIGVFPNEYYGKIFLLVGMKV